MELSHDQTRALCEIERWYVAGDRRCMTLGGYAGTGKTTIISQLQRRLPNTKIAYCAYTAKAAAVLRAGLREAGVRTETRYETRNGETYARRHVTTAHSLLYRPSETVRCARTNTSLILGDDSARGNCGSPGCVGPCFRRSEIKWEFHGDRADGVNLIVIDEASMVSENLWNDLLRTGKRVLAVGDHGQLPPIGEDAFNLMDERRLDVTLKKIHRQAEGSAIIRAAETARKTGRVPRGFDRSADGEGFVLKCNAGDHDVPPINFADDLLILSGRNRTRVMWNGIARRALGRDGDVTIGDRVVCLRNGLGVYNGLTGTVVRVGERSGGTVSIAVRCDDTLGDEVVGDYGVRAVITQFNREKTFTSDELRTLNLPRTGSGLWDFGHALTVHKAQGSAADRVLLLEEHLPGGVDAHKRWLYTAITRARRRLLIIE